MSNGDRSKVIEILLVEDSTSDAHLMIETLNESRVLHQLHLVKDGVQAIDFLYKQGKYNNTPRPDLILLDLNLPKKSGKEVLAQIKTDEDLKTIPVVVLTTSANQEDILRSYELQANCYLVKPVHLDHFIAMVKSIESFWLAVATLPPRLE